MRCSCPWCGNDAVEGCESLMGEPACAAHDYSEIGKQDVLKPVGTPLSCPERASSTSKRTCSMICKTTSWNSTAMSADGKEDMFYQHRIVPGVRITFYSEECLLDERGPTGVLRMDGGEVILNGETYGGKGFWVKCDDGSRRLIQREWLVD